jgi:hypothetical protein
VTALSVLSVVVFGVRLQAGDERIAGKIFEQEETERNRGREDHFLFPLFPSVAFCSISSLPARRIQFAAAPPTMREELASRGKAGAALACL